MSMTPDARTGSGTTDGGSGMTVGMDDVVRLAKEITELDPERRALAEFSVRWHLALQSAADREEDQ